MAAYSLQAVSLLQVTALVLRRHQPHNQLRWRK